MLKSNTKKAKPQIVIKRLYQHPIEKVWQAIATEQGMANWLMPLEDFEPKLGNEFRMKTKPYGKFDGTVICRILDIEPPHRMKFTWESNVLPETEVVFDLKKTKDLETLFTLSHSGFSGVSGFFTKMILGAGWWNLLRKKLVNYLANET